MYCLNLFPVYPHSNILHNAVLEILEYLIEKAGINKKDGNNNIEYGQFICSLIKAGLIRKIIEGLKQKGSISYKFHFRFVIIA
jgi:hypothetical protein